MGVKGGPLGTAASGEPLHPAVKEAAQQWAADDPDPATRTELERLVDAAWSDADAKAAAEVTDAMKGMLAFGTAGLRGRLGPGPNRMNRAVVIRAAAGLTAYLKDGLRDAATGPFVVIGYDARTNSDVFASDTAAVVVGAGGRAAVLPRPLPTPVLAFAIRHLGADAGVMVTASHNPPEDNGYKVYLGDGAQIVSPTDAEIAARISEVESVASVPRAEDGWTVVGEEVVTAYLDAAAAVVAPDSPRDVSVVHTALHGVGTETVLAAFERAGFPTPLVVESQAQPDPAFPTVTFPNPEEPGAIDAALELAEQTGPDLVIANDPDADRCAVAVPGPGGWRMLRGDEVGALLGSHLLAQLSSGRGAPATPSAVAPAAPSAVAPAAPSAVAPAAPSAKAPSSPPDRLQHPPTPAECASRASDTPPGPVFACSIVSSRLLAAMCAAAGVAHEETLTGFKWIARVPGLAYGYEEALGYCCDPGSVCDKDGITAALLVAELAAGLKAQGLTLLDRLDELATLYGVHATDSFSVRVKDLRFIDATMRRLREAPPESVGGVPVSRMDDLAEGDGGLPPTEGLRWYLADDSRVIVRPSGTEPKLKVYLEVVEPVAEGELPAARRRADLRLSDIRAEMEALTGL